MTTKELASRFRQVLGEHEHGALGGIDLAEALAQAATAICSDPEDAANTQKMYDRACADIQEYSAAIGRVRAIHFPLPNCESALHPRPECNCGSENYDECPTISALDEAPEPSQGVALIAAERARQVTEEGYDAEHDREHSSELARAGAAYAYGVGYFLEYPELPVARRQYLDTVPADMWPWSWDSWKPGDDIERTLVKAGALIVAAIDALMESEQK